MELEPAVLVHFTANFLARKFRESPRMAAKGKVPIYDAGRKY